VTCLSDTTAVCQSLAVGYDDMKMIEQSTRQQRSNSLWRQLREKKLTASNFGAVLAAADRHLSDSLFTKLQGLQVFSRTPHWYICYLQETY